MAATATEIKEQIIFEVGDVDPVTGDRPIDETEGLLFTRIDWLWDRWASQGQVAPGLRELFVKRSCIRMVMAVLAQKRFDVTDVLAGFGMKASQVYDHYSAMHDCCKAEILFVLNRYAVSTRPVAGRLVTRAPVTPRRPPDANSPRYGGDPYYRRRFWL